MSVENESLKADKQRIIEKYRLHTSDTGSPEVQTALLTDRIQRLTDHLQKHKKDFHTRRGLLRLVGQRRRILDYLKERDIESYRALVAQLDLRR